MVVEAGVRSGSLHTAHTAAALGRLVMAVPGPVTSVQSTGCHTLLREHTATLVGSVADIRDTLTAPEPGPAAAPSSYTTD